MVDGNKNITEAWKYFLKLDNDNEKAKCTKCGKYIACKGSSTSGLNRHLASVHSIDININKRKEFGGHDDEQCPSKRSKFLQKQLTQFLPTKRESLSEIVAKLAAVDGFSVNAICKSQFIRQALRNQQYILPKVHKHVMKLIYEYFEIARKKTIDKIINLKQNEAKFSLTLDEWTSLKNRRYINVNIHILGGDVINLGLVKITGSCPAEKALTYVDQKLNEFGLSGDYDVVAATTDGASVMKKFGRISQYYHQQCYNHAIHLAVIDVIYKHVEEVDPEIHESEQDNYSCSEDDSFSDSFSVTSYSNNEEVSILRPDIKTGLNNVRKIVRLFRLSPVKNSILQNYINIEHGRELILLLDCKTRWNSIEPMLERFFKVLDCILKALNDLNFSSYWEREFEEPLRDLLNILKPITIAVEALGRRDSNLITSDAILLFLYNSLEEYDSNFAKELLQSIKKRITERRNVELVSLLKYLQNPDYLEGENNVDFPNCTKYAITKLTKQFMYRLFKSSEGDTEVENNAVAVDSDSDCDIVEVNKNIPFTTIESGTEMEVLRRRLLLAIKESQKIKKLSTNNYNYNKTVQKEMSVYEGTGKLTQNLLKLFDALKTIQPTSTESERVFSTSSNFCTKKRANLSDKSLNTLSFLKSFFLSNQNN